MDPKTHIPPYRAIRYQLIFLMSVVLVSVFAFVSYGYYVSSSVVETLTLSSPTKSQLMSSVELLDVYAQWSYYFLAFVVVCVTGYYIHLIMTLNISLSEITAGVTRLSEGEFSQKISRLPESELGLIAQFLNQTSSRIGLLVQAERDKTSLITDDITDGVIILDRDRVIMTVNKSAIDMLHIAADQMIGSRIEAMFGSTQSPDLEAALWDLIEPRVVELKLNPSDAKGHTLRLRLIPVKSLTGTLTQIIVIVRDVSREQELETMKLDFISIAAHELRTPLTAIRGYSHLLMKKVQKENISQLLQPLPQRIVISADRLNALIDNILSAAKIERNTFVVKPTLVNLYDLIRDIVDGFQQQALLKRQKLTFDFDRQDYQVMGDSTRLMQVVGNLISNALNYTGTDGSILVRLCGSDQSRAVVQVVDTGRGIPADSIPHLFTKFYRVNTVFEQGTIGTGLGLYICKSIIEQHHGQIGVASILGKGSMFTFTLPLYKGSM